MIFTFTLHRYIFREAFKVFAAATLALTLILSLGMILRPVQEHGVGPQQVFHLIGYFLPITLTFVMPIAALFAASLSYGRLAFDNELDACRASGIGLYTLVYPGLVLAMMVAIANLILSFYVTPAFVQRAEKSLKADAQKIVFRNIQQKGYYSSPNGDWQIYSDYVDFKNKMLSGVILSNIEHGQIEKIITCDNVQVDFNPQERFNEIRVTSDRTYMTDLMENSSFEAGPLSFSEEIPPLLGDDIKFKKIDKIKQIQNNYMLFDPVAKLAFETYGQFTTELLAQDINKTLGDEYDKYYKLHSDQRVIRFTASSCTAKKEQVIELSGDIFAEEYEVHNINKALKYLRCSKAVIYVEGQQDLLNLTMVFHEAKWKTPEGIEGTSLRPNIRGLIIPHNITSVTDKRGTDNILNILSDNYIASTLAAPSEALLTLGNKLREKILKTHAQIVAETHSRLAFGIGCLPLIMIGIGLGIIKKGGHLLSAFGVSSIPAAILIVCIMSGRNIIENLGSNPKTGMTLVWAGPVCLFVLMMVIYQRLLKN